MTYDAYGKLIESTGAVDEHNHRYTGKPVDSTGLYYYGARFFDPELGRFITVDPARDGMNWYGYANANPLIFIDPTGTSSTYNAEYEARNQSERATQEDKSFKLVGIGLCSGLHRDETVKDEVISQWICQCETTQFIITPSGIMPVKRLALMVGNGGPSGTSEDQGTGKGGNKFPSNPDDLVPQGLIKRVYNDGKVIKWHQTQPDGTPGRALFEWNQDSRYGEHYHITPDGRNRLPNPTTGNTHMWPDTLIPAEFLSFFK